MFGNGGTQVVGHESFRDQRELEVRDREKKFSSVKGKKKNRKKNSLINSVQTVLVTKDQIGHFLKPLDVFGNTPNLRVGFWNLPKYITRA